MGKPSKAANLVEDLNASLKLPTPKRECNSVSFGNREVAMATDTKLGTIEALTARLYTPSASNPKKGKMNI